MLKNYIKMAWKVLLRRKFFTFVSLFGIAFTLMILVPVTTEIDSMISAAPPESNIDRILFIKRMTLKGKDNINISSPSYYFLNRYVTPLKTPEIVSFYSNRHTMNYYHNDKKLNINFKYTDAEFWNILDFTFISGRPYNNTEVRNADYVAVVSKKLSSEMFGALSPVGKAIEIKQIKYRIIGVVDNVTKNRESYADAWLPLSTSRTENFRQFNYLGGFNAMLLASTRSDLPAIIHEFNTTVKKAEIPEPGIYNRIICPIKDNIGWINESETGETNTNILHLVTLLIFLFMLLPAVNLINLNISRIMERSSEIAIRKSFGASSFSLVMQFLIENLLITFTGGIIGIIPGLLLIHISNTFNASDLNVNGRVIFYYFGFILFFTVLSGLYPAFRMSRLNPIQGLKGELR